MHLLLSQARAQNACCVIATHDEHLAQQAGLHRLQIICVRDDDGGITATLEGGH
jgi:putative ABC transport system ATP-binding protein